MDGAEIIISGLLSAILQKEWNLSSLEIAFLGSAYYIGVCLGTILAGIFCDLLGRRKTLLIGTIVQSGIFFLILLVHNFDILIIIRFLLGLVMGFIQPISLLLITEISTKEYRGRCSVSLNFMYFFG